MLKVGSIRATLKRGEDNIATRKGGNVAKLLRTEGRRVRLLTSRIDAIRDVVGLVAVGAVVLKGLPLALLVCPLEDGKGLRPRRVEAHSNVGDLKVLAQAEGDVNLLWPLALKERLTLPPGVLLVVVEVDQVLGWVAVLWVTGVAHFACLLGRAGSARLDAVLTGSFQAARVGCLDKGVVGGVDELGRTANRSHVTVVAGGRTCRHLFVLIWTVGVWTAGVSYGTVARGGRCL